MSNAKTEFKIGDLVTISLDAREWEGWDNKRMYHLFHGSHEITEIKSQSSFSLCGFGEWLVPECYLSHAPPERDHTVNGKFVVFDKSELHPMYRDLRVRLPKLQILLTGAWTGHNLGASTNKHKYRIPIEQYEADLAAWQHCQKRGLNMTQAQSGTTT